MPEFDEFNPEGLQEAEQQGGSALRKWAEEQAKLRKAAEKRITELEAAEAKRNAESTFTQLEIPEKVRKFYQGEATKEAIEAWWKENADVFGASTALPDETPSPEQLEQASNLTNLQKVNEMGSQSAQLPGINTLEQLGRDFFKNNKNPSESDLDALLAQHGILNRAIVAPHTG